MSLRFGCEVLGILMHWNELFQSTAALYATGTTLIEVILVTNVI